MDATASGPSMQRTLGFSCNHCTSLVVFIWKSFSGFLRGPYTWKALDDRSGLYAPQWGTDAVLWSDFSGLQTPSKIPQFSCKTCGKVFSHRDSLTHHRSSHQGQTICPVCQKVFSRVYTMKYHMSTIHKLN
ncbi:hypothetical protein B7P43_G08534 [Cryptotermes secundus]|uniref:C2H2-type domain-containing protein n=1 Tax=Cryptotermes secundus TaxID=105785 RepID=A0A2J7QF01_9NEOP|nr:hypothetical protein B7P43_G08534 [Cryptotermes secundus]